MIRRLALPKETFLADCDVQCSDASCNKFLSTLSRCSAAHDWLAQLLKQTTSIKLSGSAWHQLVSQHEMAPPVSKDGKPDVVVAAMAAVKKTELLAIPRTTWSADVKLTLYDSENEPVGKLTIFDDIVEVSILATRVIHDELELDRDMQNEFDNLRKANPPSIFDCLSTLPLVVPVALAPTTSSRWQFMPEWTVSTFLLWLSQQLRIHVLFSASSVLDDECIGSKPRIFVDRAIMEHVNIKGITARRITFTMHDSTGCICQHHRKDATAVVGPHSKTFVRLDFCGCRHDGKCPFHDAPSCTKPVCTEPLSSSVCTHKIRLTVQCVHANEDLDIAKHSFVTCVDVKLESSPFAVAFCTACVELTEGIQTKETAEKLEEYVSKAFEKSMAAVEPDDDAPAPDDLQMRDQIVESIIRSKEFYFGHPTGRNNGKHMLRRKKRKHRDQGAVPAWMSRCMSTHAHLMPNC